MACRCGREHDGVLRLLPRDIGPYLVDRYRERKESAEELSKRVNQKAI